MTSAVMVLQYFLQWTFLLLGLEDRSFEENTKMQLENHRHWQESVPNFLFFPPNWLGFHMGRDHWYWYWHLYINLASVVNCPGICFLLWKQDSLNFWFGSRNKTGLGTEHIITNNTIHFNSHQWFFCFSFIISLFKCNLRCQSKTL